MAAPIAAVLAALGLAIAVPAQAGTLYCCRDASGRKTCGDTLPEACYGRAYQEIGEHGIKNFEAPLTGAQKAQREAETKRKQELDREALEARRRDQALLDTYGSVKDIDYMREHALSGVARELKLAQDKYDQLQQTREQLARQAAPYAKKGLPPDLAGKIRGNDADLLEQVQLIERKQQDMAAIRAKYDTEKQRYLELTGGNRPVSATSAAPR
jgi:hypothetical protein